MISFHPMNPALAGVAFGVSALLLGACAAPTTAADGVIPDGFESRMIETPGADIHTVYERGDGDAVVLIHGWPQDWSEWRHVMPQLADDYQVIAVDLRGVGASGVPADGPTGGYDKETIAKDIVAVLDALKIGKAHIVGHDIGGMVAFTLAADHADRALSVTIADVPLPGLASFDIIARDPRAWHFGFHATADLAVEIVEGDEIAYFSHFYDALSMNKDVFSEADIARFAAAYEGADRLRAGFAFYAAFPEDAEALVRADLFDAPQILLLGGEASMAGLLPMIAGELEAKGAASVSTAVINGAGHWIAEENPDAVADALDAFFRQQAARRVQPENGDRHVQ